MLPSSLRCWLRNAPALVLVLVWSHPVAAQVSPEESAQKLKPAAGLQATLFAAEPMVINPTTIDVDSRGRVWVTEGLNYRHTLHRDQPKFEDADKIKILEDTDGDGKADKVTVFADKIFPVPMGIALEERWGTDGKYQGCRVFVGNSPDLLVLEDTDGDDVADKRYPLLTGFGGYDHDHGVHGMVFGPDGKLYFTQGDGTNKPEAGRRGGQFDVTDASGRRVFNDQLGSTLRANRDGTQFEILADRHRNPYETSVNSFGHVFTSDNDDDGNRGSRVIGIMDGGRFGYRTPGSPRHWGEEVPGNVPKLVGTGNGSPCGVMVYEGSLLPKEYRGAVLEAEAGPRVINAFPLTRKGAAFRTEHTILLSSDDPWFRPVDVTAAPDGSLFVADWYDAGVGGHAFRDQTTGRIYRVAPTGSKYQPKAADFATLDGQIAALASPVVAARDAARRVLIARGKASVPALTQVFQKAEPHQKARALWVLAEIEGPSAAIRALKDTDPRLRELAVRILGRDCRDVGKVEYEKPEAKLPALASAHLDALLPLSQDPDAGVRRELILALRNLPTDQVGDALRTLAASWDGQDRWYLEALGLALRQRESEYLTALFDGTLYGKFNPRDAGQAFNLALPPYFPVDRNEAFLATGDPEPLPASPLSKTLGLAWQVHRPEVLPWLGKVLPVLQSPELRRAADDVLMQINDPAGAVALAELSGKLRDPERKRQILATLARKLDGAWKPASANPEVVRVIESALNDPSVRTQAIAVAASTGDSRYAEALFALIQATKTHPEDRAAAVEAVARLGVPRTGEFLEDLIAQARDKKASDPAAEAAVRSLPRLGNARDRLVALLSDEATPLGLRRAALRTFATLNDGGSRLLEMARDKTVPESLKGDATTVLYAHPDRRIRDEAMKVLPITSASGKPLPPIFDLIRREGNAERGQAAFFRVNADRQAGGTQACGACHRVQGQGQWVGPDLSTIGVKYGRDELLRSILSPSAAIGYNYVTSVVALKDGQVLTGLPVEDTPERLVLKTAEGKRITLRPADIDERTTSEVSLMPEGLAQTMTEAQLVDLLAFLETLKRPVSVVGEFMAVGPIAEILNPARPTTGGQTWDRVTADAEGRFDLTSLAGDDPKKAAYLITPVTAPVALEARLVLDTRAPVQAWLNGKPLAIPTAQEDGVRSLPLAIPMGVTELLIRVSGGGETALVVTVVADRPVDFGAVRFGGGLSR